MVQFYDLNQPYVTDMSDSEQTCGIHILLCSIVHETDWQFVNSMYSLQRCGKLRI